MHLTRAEDLKAQGGPCGQVSDHRSAMHLSQRVQTRPPNTVSTSKKSLSSPFEKWTTFFIFSVISWLHSRPTVVRPLGELVLLLEGVAMAVTVTAPEVVIVVRSGSSRAGRAHLDVRVILCVVAM